MSNIKSLNPTVKIDSWIRAKIRRNAQKESQVIVHVTIRFRSKWTQIRIWNSIYLFSHDSRHKSKLIHCENIPRYPDWQEIPPYTDYHFTMVFSGLPKNCTKFNLIEVISEPGGFKVMNITRNQEDVYHFEI